MCAGGCKGKCCCGPDTKPGNPGRKGDAGPPTELTLDITMTPAGTPPTVVMTGTPPVQHGQLFIPFPDPPTASATLTLVPPSSPASVAVTSPTPNNFLFDFVLPRAQNGIDGTNAFGFTVGASTVPAVAGPAATIQLQSQPGGQWPVVGQPIFLQGMGHFRVEVVFANFLSISNPGWPGAASPGTVIPAGTKVSPSGERGPAGIAGTQATPTFINIVTIQPTGAPAPGQETAFVTDSLTTPTSFYVTTWNGTAWVNGPSIMGPAGTLIVFVNSDPSSSPPAGPVGTVIIRTDVLGVYRKNSASTAVLEGSLTPTFDQVWTESGGEMTAPLLPAVDSGVHGSAGPYIFGLSSRMHYVDVQDDIELAYDPGVGLTNGDWIFQLENTTGGSINITYSTGDWAETAIATAPTSLGAGAFVELHARFLNGRLTINNVVVPSNL